MLKEDQDVFFDELIIGEKKKYYFLIHNCFKVRIIKPAGCEYLKFLVTTMYDEDLLGFKAGEQFYLHTSKKAFSLKFIRAWRPYKNKGLEEANGLVVAVELERVNKIVLNLKILRVSLNGQTIKPPEFDSPVEFEVVDLDAWMLEPEDEEEDENNG